MKRRASWQEGKPDEGRTRKNEIPGDLKYEAEQSTSNHLSPLESNPQKVFYFFQVVTFCEWSLKSVVFRVAIVLRSTITCLRNATRTCLFSTARLQYIEFPKSSSKVVSNCYQHRFTNISICLEILTVSATKFGNCLYNRKQSNYFFRDV